LATEGARCPMVRLPEVFTSLLRGVSVPPRKTSESSRDFQAAYDGMRRLLDVAQSGYCDIAAGLFLSPGGVHAAQGCYLQGGLWGQGLKCAREQRTDKRAAPQPE
jgi:hypothetical protein